MHQSFREGLAILVAAPDTSTLCDECDTCSHCIHIAEGARPCARAVVRPQAAVFGPYPQPGRLRSAARALIRFLSSRTCRL